MREHKKELICIILFSLILLCLSATVLSGGDRLYSPWEKRMLAQKPKFRIENVLDGSYGSDYETWLTDQFPGRDWWVGVKTRCEILLRKKEIRGIYLGKGGYLFSDHTKTTDWDRLEQQMVGRYGQKRVSRIHVPAAGAVLTEQLPAGLVFSHREDEVWENLYRHREEYLYYRTDHHWTMRGAYYAYEAWAKERGLAPAALEDLGCETVKGDFLGTHYGKLHYAKEADTIERYGPDFAGQVVYDLGESKLTGLYQWENLDSEDAYRFFLDGNHPVVQIETGQGSGHLVVLKDSFANCLVPYLTLHYEKITVIDPRYFRADVAEWLAGQEVTEVLIVAQDTIEAEAGY